MPIVAKDRAELLADALISAYTRSATKRPKSLSAHSALLIAWMQELCARAADHQMPELRQTARESLQLIKARKIPMHHIKYETENFRKAVAIIKENSAPVDAEYLVASVQNPFDGVARATVMLRDVPHMKGAAVDVRLVLLRSGAAAVQRGAHDEAIEPRIILRIRVQVSRTEGNVRTPRRRAKPADESQLREELERRRLLCGFLLGRDDVQLEGAPRITTAETAASGAFAEADLVLPAEIGLGNFPNFLAAYAETLSAVEARAVFGVSDVSAAWKDIRERAAMRDPQPFEWWDPLTTTPQDPGTLVLSNAAVTYQVRRGDSAISIIFGAPEPRELSHAMRGLPILALTREVFGFPLRP